MIDYYSVLGVSHDVTQEQLKKSYISLVKLYHPDVTTFDKQFAEAKIKQINEAYSVLSDERKRKEYDVKLFQSIYKSDLHKKSSPSDDDKVKRRVTDLCIRYFRMLERQVVERPSYAVNNHIVCDKLSEDFLEFISSDFEYLLSRDLLHGDIAHTLALTFWKFATCYTWADDYPKAERYMLIIETFLEPSSSLYSAFVHDKKIILKNSRKFGTVNFSRHSSGSVDSLRDNVFSFNWLSFLSSTVGLKILPFAILALAMSVITHFNNFISYVSSNLQDKPASITQKINEFPQYVESDINRIFSHGQKPSVSLSDLEKSVDAYMKKTDAEIMVLAKQLKDNNHLVPRKYVTRGYDPAYLIDTTSGHHSIMVNNTVNDVPVHGKLRRSGDPDVLRCFFVGIGESFLLNDLPAGTYVLSFSYLFENMQDFYFLESPPIHLIEVKNSIGRTIGYTETVFPLPPFAQSSNGFVRIQKAQW